MVTSDPSITAVGECVEHRGLCYGLVAPLWEMCASLADGLTTGSASGYQGSVTSTKLKVSGIDDFAAGDFSGAEGSEDLVRIETTRGCYKRVDVMDVRVVGDVFDGTEADKNA